jgi:hypothetical protein
MTTDCAPKDESFLCNLELKVHSSSSLPCLF